MKPTQLTQQVSLPISPPVCREGYHEREGETKNMQYKFLDSKVPKNHPKLLSLKNITWFVCINNGEHEHEHRTSAEHVGGDGEIDGAHGRLANGVGNNWNLQKILIRMRTLSRKKTKESRQVREMIPINSL